MKNRNRGPCLISKFLLILFWILIISSGKYLYATEALRIFFDCSDCDTNYLKERVAFVNYVHDRKDADLHVLVTHQTTASGLEYQINFIGLGNYKNKDRLFKLSYSNTETSDEWRQRFTQTFMLGLLGYIADSDLAEQIKVTYEQKSQNTPISRVRDRWNSWIFSVSANGYQSGEESSKYRSLKGSLNGSRITESWKITFGTDINQQKNYYKLPDNSTISSSIHGYSMDTTISKSLGHWSLGAGTTLQKNTFYNLDPSSRLALAIEYNVFPYKESAQHIWTTTYFVGGTKLNYAEETIFDKTKEISLTQGLSTSFGTKRPWGDAEAGIEFSYLGNLNQNQLIFQGNTSWRVIRVLSIDLYGSAQLIHNQIYLTKSRLSPEDILIQSHALKTSFSNYVGMGMTFTFGSIYNNTVNTRLKSLDLFSKIF